MYFIILSVSSGRFAVAKAAFGLLAPVAGRSGKSSPLSDRLLVRLAFFRLIVVSAPPPSPAPSCAVSTVTAWMLTNGRGEGESPGTGETVKPA
uniref:Putative secreted protein n=1 Tax=Anopheles marajoara TaxID=58244 RepID=A0A2M4C9T3_9DIPT